MVNYGFLFRNFVQASQPRRRCVACPHIRTANHLQVRPVLGRNGAPHDADRNVLSHLVVNFVQNGVTDAAVVETRLTAADGGTFDADVVFFDPSSRTRII